MVGHIVMSKTIKQKEISWIKIPRKSLRSWHMSMRDLVINKGTIPMVLGTSLCHICFILPQLNPCKTSDSESNLLAYYQQAWIFQRL